MYGKEIDARIKELKISQQEVAKLVGVSNTEIKCIRDDKRKTLKKETFLKLMTCLNLSPYDFGGFAKLDFSNPNDFISSFNFLAYLKEEIKKDPLLTAREISVAAGISEAQLSRILHGQRTEISIDTFVYICNYVGVDYRTFLVDKNIVPSFNVDNDVDISKLEILKKQVSMLSSTDIDNLIRYANFLLKSNAYDTETVNRLIKEYID
mgnify:FL=1